jgi:hypothetical protein
VYSKRKDNGILIPVNSAPFRSFLEWGWIESIGGKIASFFYTLQSSILWQG